MPRGTRTIAVALAAALAGAASGARADVLYVLTNTGLLRATDPATGAVFQRSQLRTPGKIVTNADGLGAVPGGGGLAYALVGLGDDCALDPTRTLFAGGVTGGCEYLHPREECEQGFVVTWGGQPQSCTWSGGACDLCGSCPNTCVPPPPCLGSSRTRWAGFGVESCRQLDGDAAACAEAYYSDEFGGTFSCFESAGQCLGCDVAAQVAGACTFGCQPAAACVDPSRDVFTGYYGCWLLFADAAGCERSFQSAGSEANARTMACFVGGDGYCTWCDSGGEAGGFCVNTCETPPACTGDPVRTAVPACYVHDDDPAACAQAFTTGPDGGPEACFVNEVGSCSPCNRAGERQGRCLNACAPPVCTSDPDRSTLLDPPADCHAFDGDSSACAAAYFVGRCGISSCHYDAQRAACRPCTVEDPERCENACGTFEGLDFARAPALITVDLAAGSATVVGSPGVSLRQPVPDATGVIHALSWYGGCVDPSALFRLDPSDLRPSLVAMLAGFDLGALALHPGDGQLYRLATDGLFATDPVTGLTTPIALGGPVSFYPGAMTWAPACNAFLVADGFDGLWLLNPATGSMELTVIHLEGECDEGDCATGLVMDGTTVCPPLTFPTFTTTTTSTSTSSSTSTSTLPSELITGSRLLLIDDPQKPRKRRMTVRSRDETISLGGGNGSGDDPVVHGGTLRVVATSGSFDAIYQFADGWRYIGKVGRDKGYALRGRGPVHAVVLRPGRLEIRGKGEALGQSLFVDPGAVQVVLQLGGRRWCLEFGGAVEEKTPKKMSARNAPAPASCAEP